MISYTRQGVRFVTALGSASRDITHETGGTICYGHWVLRLVISHTRQGVRFATGIGFCVLWYHTRAKKYNLLHERGGTTCFGHWALCLVISHTRQGVRFVTGYHTRDRGYDLLRALGSASCDITHETGSTICYGHWVRTRGTICFRHSVLRLVISYTRQGVRFVTGIGFCVL